MHSEEDEEAEAQIVYQNGEVVFEEELGYYMPIHQDELYRMQIEEFLKVS